MVYTPGIAMQIGVKCQFCDVRRVAGNKLNKVQKGQLIDVNLFGLLCCCLLALWQTGECRL